jgi:hypothetical protein
MVAPGPCGEPPSLIIGIAKVHTGPVCGITGNFGTIKLCKYVSTFYNPLNGLVFDPAPTEISTNDDGKRTISLRI